MRDPAPPFGRGWICLALLLGLLAGGGITWVALARRAARTSPVVLVARPLDPAKSLASADAGALPPPLAGPGNEAAAPGTGPRLLPFAASQEGATTEPAAVVWAGSVEPEQLPAVHLDSERMLHSHPKAEASLANALAAMGPFTKKGFGLRDKVWEGEISLDEGKAISCQFFKGNDYCFCVGTDAKGARLSLQFYGDDGAPADADESGQEFPAGASATACLRCRQTGTYFVVVKLEATTQEKVPWGMVSAYR